MAKPNPLSPRPRRFRRLPDIPCDLCSRRADWISADFAELLCSHHFSLSEDLEALEAAFAAPLQSLTLSPEEVLELSLSLIRKLPQQ